MAAFHRFMLGKFGSWFNSPQARWDYREATKKHDGEMDEKYLCILFKSIEYNIVRAIRLRSLPGFKKEIETDAKVVVGCLQENQWKVFRDLLISKQEPKDISIRKHRLPGFQDDKICEYRETLLWGDDYPASLYNEEAWFINKWVDGNNVTWRAFVTEFGIRYNSYNGTINIMFEYKTQHFSKSFKRWMFA